VKRWMIVGFAAGAALFGYSPVLVAAAGIAGEGEADWIADVQRYVDSYTPERPGPGTPWPKP
jgi:hypothetical protein